MTSAMYLEMYRRGDFLPRTSILSRRDTLLEQQETLKNDISDKMEALRAVEATLSFDAAFLAPIRSVPLEILSHIFFLAREDYTSVLFDDILIVIGQVCKLWRTLTRSTPTLWADLRICIDESRSQNTRLQIDNVIQRACALIQDSLLDLTVVLPHDFVGSQRYVQQNTSAVVDLIMAQLYRWRSLDYDGSFRYLERIIQKAKGCKLELPQLETLRLCCTLSGVEQSQIDNATASVSAGFSNLTRLETNFPPDLMTATTWPKLTSFSGPFFNSSSCYDFLKNSPCLSRITITCMGVPLGNSGAQTRSVLILPNVEKLTVSDCVIVQILDDLSLPWLKELTIQSMEATHSDEGVGDPPSPPLACLATIGNQPALAIQSLIVRSRCNLGILSLDDYMDFDQCVPLLELCSSSLTTLKLTFDCFDGNDVALFFGALVASDGSSLLPQLSELSIKTRRGLSSSSSVISMGGWLDKILWSRRDSGDVVNLTKLYLRTDEWNSIGVVHEGEFRFELDWHAASALVMSLLELEKEGLKVDWKRGRDNTDIMEHERQFLATIS